MNEVQFYVFSVLEIAINNAEQFQPLMCDDIRLSELNEIYGIHCE